MPNTQPRSIAPPPVEAAATDTARRIKDMPRDVGWLLLAAGLVGEVAPGVFGTPFWVMGSLILFPRIGARMETWLERRAPILFNGGMRQVGRFLDDLERRYPRRDHATKPHTSAKPRTI